MSRSIPTNSYKAIPLTGTNSDIIHLGIFYLIAHGGIFFIPNAVFWDDWVLFNQDQMIILDIFRQAGSIFNISGYLHLIMLSAGIWFYKYLTFLLMFISGILLNEILKPKNWITKEARFTITLLFIILPFNSARVCLINFPSIFGHFTFFLAWYMMSKNRILSLILFFFSFNISSLLMFYSIPIADLYLRSGFSFTNLNPQSILKFCIKKIDFIVLPFIFFLIKILYFKPYGLYSGYNENFNLTDIWKIPVYQTLDLLNQSLQINILLFIGLFLLTASVLWSKLDSEITYTSRYLKYGAIIFLFAVFPYWIIGTYPTFTNWSSRHQLLLPLGTSIFIIGLASILSSKKRTLLLIILVSVSISMSLSAYYQFYIDWIKQKELISLFKNEQLIKESKLIIFQDNALNKNAFERNYTYYEWSGQLKYAFNDDSRLGLSVQDTNLLKTDAPEKQFIANYNVRNFNPDQSSQSIFVNIYEKDSKNTQDKIRQFLHPKFILNIEVLEYNPDSTIIPNKIYYRK